MQVQTLVAAGTTAICGTVSVGVGDAVDDVVGETVDDTINVTANSQSKKEKRKEWQVSGSVVVLSWQVCHQCATSVSQVRCSKKEKRTNVSLVPVSQSIAATDAGGVAIATHAIGIGIACFFVNARRARRSSTIHVRFIAV